MDEQTKRLEQRIHDGRKIWKLSPMDLKSYSRWYDYGRARDDMFQATDSSWAPWYAVRSDDKKRARLNIIKHILGRIPYKEAPRGRSSCRSARSRQLQGVELPVQVHSRGVLTARRPPRGGALGSRGRRLAPTRPARPRSRAPADLADARADHLADQVAHRRVAIDDAQTRKAHLALDLADAGACEVDVGTSTGPTTSETVDDAASRL
jgi:hypothetical protein